MFFATTAPTDFRSQVYAPAARSLERFMEETQCASRQKSCAVSQDDSAYTLTFDVPGVAREQLSIGLEGSIVRLETKEGAPRQYKQAYELPQDIDATSSQAKLENGVLTLKLTKQVPVSKVTELAIN
jgi:HSP20 family molecular chaperone IbpA